MATRSSQKKSVQPSKPELEGKPKCVVRVKKVAAPQGKEGEFKQLTIYSKLDKISVGPLSPEEWAALLSEHPPENLVVQYDYKERVDPPKK